MDLLALCVVQFCSLDASRESHGKQSQRFLPAGLGSETDLSISNRSLTKVITLSVNSNPTKSENV